MNRIKLAKQLLVLARKLVSDTPSVKGVIYDANDKWFQNEFIPQYLGGLNPDNSYFDEMDLDLYWYEKMYVTVSFEYDGKDDYDEIMAGKKMVEVSIYVRDDRPRQENNSTLPVFSKKFKDDGKHLADIGRFIQDEVKHVTDKLKVTL